MISNLPHKSSGDRFIPRRKNNNFDILRFNQYQIRPVDQISSSNDDDGVGFTNVAKETLNRFTYIEEITRVLVPTSKNNILSFSSPKKSEKRTTVKNKRNLWPVLARSKPLFQPPPTVLDLPGLDAKTCHNLVDWSKTGYVATVFNNELHVWHSKHEVNTNISIKGNLHRYIKWDWDGSHIAVSDALGRICILNFKTLILAKVIVCECGSCVVTTMEFTENKLFAFGCSRGRISIYNNKYRKLKSTFSHCGRVVSTIKSSCNGKYIAASFEDKGVEVWLMPHLLNHLKIDSFKFVKSLAWHPWNEWCLVFGCGSHFAYCNVNKKTVNHYHWKHTVINCLSFNPISAELAVGYCCCNSNKEKHILAVLTDFDTIVDQVVFHRAAIVHLLWNETGSQLATCGVDENFCLWDFFGNKTEKMLKKYKMKEFSTNCLKNLNIFGSTIR